MSLKKVYIILGFVSLLFAPAINGQSQDTIPATAALSGLSVDAFHTLVNRKDRLVLVSFSADWCIVCKRQEPVLQAIENEYSRKIDLLRIDMGLNPKIAEYFEVDGLPVLLLYKNGRLVWNRVGFLRKEEIKERLNLYP